MMLYIFTGYWVHGIVYLDQLTGAHRTHTHIPIRPIHNPIGHFFFFFLLLSLSKYPYAIKRVPPANKPIRPIHNLIPEKKSTAASTPEIGKFVTFIL